MALGAFCVVTMLPLLAVLRRPSPVQYQGVGMGGVVISDRPLGLSPTTLHVLLIVAGVA